MALGVTEPASPCLLFGQLRAFALDLGGSTLEEPTDLEIVVVDQNDNRPVFLQDVFRGRILEGAIPGEVGAQTPPMGWVFRRSRCRLEMHLPLPLCSVVRACLACQVTTYALQN